MLARMTSGLRSGLTTALPMIFASAAGSVLTLAVVSGNRYYELKVFSRSDRGVSPSADRFFDSLRIFAPDKEPGE